MLIVKYKQKAENKKSINNKKYAVKKNIKTSSSNQWMSRQLNDRFVNLAHQEGYFSRSAYKLLEIDKKFNFIKNANSLLDLGAAPGGWLQVVSNIRADMPKLIGVDLLPIKYKAKNMHALRGDFTLLEITDKLKNLLDNNKLDVILSDMAPNTSGYKFTDHMRIMDLAKSVFNFAKNHLSQNGTLVVKLFQGEEFSDYVKMIKQNFNKVSLYVPNASRKESKEVYMIAQGFKL